MADQESMGVKPHALRRWMVPVLLVAIIAPLAGIRPATAHARTRPTGLRQVRFLGARITVPSSWPVFNLAARPHVCVRFNRHAVYLGNPGAQEACSGRMAGRTEAILIEPWAPSETMRQALPAPSLAGADAAGGTMARLIRGRVAITLTWNLHPRLVARALRLRSLVHLAAVSRRRPPAAHLAGPGGLFARTAQTGAAPGQIYTGPGFDACSAPSTSQMSAWGSSPYRAIGVYIGGVNMGCSQPNLNSSWVAHESSAGWHLMPIYVGLQAPGNACGCAAISPNRAYSEGQAAALDAVAQAQGIGLGPGNPLYDDMEGYNQGGTVSSAVLSFLSGWTQQLHASHYKSGVYSSDASGIHDLVSKFGTGYSEPDELWIANWNGRATTSDSGVPTNEWANHQRLRQYQGNVNERHGGVLLNIDRDYLDAATAAAGSVSGPPPATTFRYWLYAATGNVYTSQNASWFGSPAASHISTSSIVGLAPTADGQGYWMADSSGHVYNYGDAARLGNYLPSQRPPVAGIVSSPTGGYWLYTAKGNVYTSQNASWYGSPAASHIVTSSIVGLAPTADGKGYWMADSSGHVYNYGDAPALANYLSATHPPLIGMASSSTGGYWLYTAKGNVYTSQGPSWYGSPTASHTSTNSIVGLAPTADGKGYWMADSSGHVYHYGDAPALANHLPGRRPRLRGIAP